MVSIEVKQEKTSNLLINIVSVAVPLVVAVLLSIPAKPDFGAWTKILPHINGVVNSLTALALICGLVFIKLKKVHLHRLAMAAAFALGGVFLVCYVIYHLTNLSTKFGGEGAIRYVYYFVLLSHIALSLVVLPLVLRAMFFAVTKQFTRHKKIVKFAYPIWLYVSITGVIAYLMIAPYYQ